jgi:hypothetical protein
MAMATGVEESPTHLTNGNTSAAIMAWMGEVPSTTSHYAAAICIARMVTRRLHSFLFASIVDIVGSHESFHPHSIKFVMIVNE